METKPVSQKVIEKIKKKKIAPEPKWKFSFARFLVWTAIAVFLAVCSAAVGIMLELLFQFNFSEIIFRPGGLRLMTVSFPYIWLIAAAVALALAAAEFLRTKHGYRYKLRYVAGIFLSFAVILGAFSFVIGSTGKMEGFLERGVPAYSRFVTTPDDFWLQPEEGLVSGEIMTADVEQKNLTVKDARQKEWNVDYGSAKVSPSVDLSKGENIKIIGKKNVERDIFAQKIRPWIRADKSAKIIKDGRVKKSEERVRWEDEVRRGNKK